MCKEDLSGILREKCVYSKVGVGEYAGKNKKS